MPGECHAHLFMDGVDYRQAVELHKYGVEQNAVRRHLKAYQDAGIDYIREGGDHFGVSSFAAEIAKEYGIEYRSPVFAICRKGHYGRIVGRSAQTLKEYAHLVREAGEQGADFIKIMISGIMEYSGFGRLSEEALDPEWISEMIHIAHEEGFAVMIHANGREAVLPAVLAGADSIEHGNYIDDECLLAMAEHGCIWVPTAVTTKNLIGCGRYDDEILKQILDMECSNILKGYQYGTSIAAGSDAGAYRVLHGKGLMDERKLISDVLAENGITNEKSEELLVKGEKMIRERFRKQ